MKRCVEFVMGVVLLLAVFVLSGPAAGVLWRGSAAVSGGASPVVALDAGHGGADPGKIGINEVLEKDINLAITLKTKELLEKEGGWSSRGRTTAGFTRRRTEIKSGRT